MKKLFIVSLLVMLTGTLSAQFYFGGGGGTAGVNYRLGYLINDEDKRLDKFDFIASVESPVKDQNISPSIQSLTAGYHFTLLENERLETRLTISPHVGIANFHTNSLGKEDAEYHNNYIKPIGSLQLNALSRVGGFFIYASYCESPFAGIGFTMIPSRL